MFRVLNAITCWAHWVNGIPKIMLEFVEIQLAETNSKLSKMGKPFRVLANLKGNHKGSRQDSGDPQNVLSLEVSCLLCGCILPCVLAVLR